MDMTSTSVMDHYTQLQQKIANRTISAEAAVKSYQEIRDELGRSTNAGGFHVMARVDPGPLLHWKNGELVDPDGAKSSDHSSGGVASIRLMGLGAGARTHFDIESTMVRGGAFEKDLFETYNRRSFSELQPYQSAHKAEWAQAARSMGIPMSGPDFPGHFFERPEGVISEFETGDPKSLAEKIFRAIASPQDIAEFERDMQRAQNKLEGGMYEAVQQFTDTMIDAGPGAPSQKLDPLRIGELFEREGVDTSRINFASFVKNPDGSFWVEGDIPNGAEMEKAISDNPELHTLLSNLWDAHGKQGSSASAKDKSGPAVDPATSAAMLAGQEVDEGDTWMEKGVEGSRTPEEIAYNRYMRMVTDPYAGANSADELARSSDVMWISNEAWDAHIEKYGTPPPPPHGLTFNDTSHPSHAVRADRMAYLETLVKQGVPPVERMKAILQYNIDLPLGYGDSMDTANERPSGAWRAQYQDQLDRLNNAIAIAEQHSASAAV